jgi:hydroxymethylpyrimidine/phosphomethylpyrimidine kinase
MRIALTIAGSDSGGGAGIQADLKTFAAFGVYGTSAITAITAQNTLGVAHVESLAADLVTAQIEAVAGDIALHATKTGMLPTSAIIEAVAAAIDELELPKVVVDPVMVASAGQRLMDADAIQALRGELLPRAFVVTPNIAEAEILAGRHIETPDQARNAAREIRELGPRAVIITGGHGVGTDVVDVLFDGQGFSELRHRRMSGCSTHGTGCTYAAALAAGLAIGDDLATAAKHAQQYVAGAIQHALTIGHGRSPLDHFWNCRPA